MSTPLTPPPIDPLALDMARALVHFWPPDSVDGTHDPSAHVCPCLECHNKTEDIARTMMRYHAAVERREL
jgi:hypothetical protein